MPAFGFSVGDIIATIELIRKLLGGLKATTGAAAQYQRTIIELESLARTLRDVERLAVNPDGGNVSLVDSLHAVAFATSLTLRDFLRKLQKYEAGLGPADHTHKAKRMARAMQWTITMDEEIDRLQLYVAGQMLSINTLLQLLEREIAQEREIRRRAEHDKMVQVMDEQMKAVNEVNRKLIPMTESASKSRQIMESLAKDLLVNTGLLSGLHQSIIQGPQASAEDSIKLDDALGRAFSLPYAYFNKWKLFESFVKHMFSSMDIPGMHQVQHGSFFVCRRDSVDKALTKSNWSANVYPGVTLTMTVILTMLKLPNQRCPKPSCGSQVSDSAERGTFITCPKCGLLFRYDPEVEALGLSTEEDKLRLIQQDADMGRFGRRSVPADVVEIQSDEEEPPTPISLSVTQPSKPPAQALSLENLAALQTMSSNGYSKKPKNNSLNPQLPSIDWNSGTSGMAAWLNSSAIPDHGIETQFPASDTYKAESDQFRQARKDIEALKRVQFVSTVPKTQPLKDTVKEYQAMALNAQIYVRKIIDRFPKIAPFLARRFANANVGRLSRLPQSSGTAEAPAVSPMEVES